MKKVCILMGLWLSLGASAQNANMIKGSLPLKQTIRLSDPSLQNWNPTLVNIREAPKHVSDIATKKAMLYAKRKNNISNPAAKELRSSIPAPVLVDSFTGNPAQGVSPPDNTMAISNAGIIVSCVNTQIEILDTTGHLLLSNSLATFASHLGFLGSISDPRVLYDQVKDQFILVFFTGSTSNNSNVIVGFTQSNDPTGGWNFYKLPGNLLGDTTWSDYPILSITNDDFFMTFNHLANDSLFPAGFKYSVIWQVNKVDGYNGDTLHYNYWHNIGYGGRPVWNICTVQGGSALTGPNAYFLSVRPHDMSNDTVFLHEINNSYLSGVAQLSTTMLVSNTSYGLPPDALQRDGQQLATNDARILSAVIENDRIHYVQNSIDPANTSSAIYLGTISHVSTSAVARGQIIGFDTIDLGYPSIAYAGNGYSDNRMIVTCSYLPAHGNPGTGAFYIDNNGNVSPMLSVVEGHSTVNMVADSTERWGDYTTVQRMYNTPNTLWLNGSYTNSVHSYQTQIAKIYNTDNSALTGIANIHPESHQIVYPNPTPNNFTVAFELESDTRCKFSLLDMQGRLVKLLLDDEIAAGTNQFSFNTSYLSPSKYQLLITTGSKTILSKPLVVTGL